MGKRLRRPGFRPRALGIVIGVATLSVLLLASTASSGGGGAPSNTSPPAISGGSGATDGTALAATSGTWSGATPISYAYQWLRCDDTGGSCNDISGATSSTYTVAKADVGHAIRVKVTATNSAGSGEATSAATPEIVAAAAPKNTARPTVSGTTTEGQTLTADKGSWSGTEPLSFKYQWQGCEANGNGCKDISGATGTTYTLASADVGKTIRVQVTATNSKGSGNGESAVTAVVAPKTAPGPAGAIKLSDGKTSIPASSVSLPERLIVSGVSFSPTVIRSHEAFTARFRVTDTRGYVVRDVLVYALGIPYSWLAGASEVRTGQDGWATITMQPRPIMPLRRGGALVVFVRARKEGDSLLAGVSTRRLVQVRIGAPS